ncbi:MAG: phosphatidate cytidylyltransferase [Lachnospiraceae bacterium]|nr:phosphatidate cytidylyltransferase [Lachnospiraceae bacterium]
MLTRIISGAALVVILGSALFFGGYYLWALCIFISIIGMRELLKVFRAPEERENFKPDRLDIVGFVCAAAYYALIYDFKEEKTFFYFIIAALIAGMCVFVVSFPKFTALRFITTYFAFIYVAVMISFIYLTRSSEKGIYTVWLIFITSWVCDTCAYFSGVALGKHKLAPVLSPKKSVEGAVGGVIGSALVGYIYGYIIGGYGISYCMICAIGAVLSQFGDLFASAIKRNYDIKDYGRLIPGHGGVLDRFDSVIVTAPVIYILSRFFQG